MLGSRRRFGPGDLRMGSARCDWVPALANEIAQESCLGMAQNMVLRVVVLCRLVKRKSRRAPESAVTPQVSRHVAKPEILDEPVAARTPEQARIAENCRVNNHAAGPDQRGNLARLRLEFASVVRRMEVECPPAAHRARAVAVEKFSDRSRLKILVVIDEDGEIMALLGDFAR